MGVECPNCGNVFTPKKVLSFAIQDLFEWDDCVTFLVNNPEAADVIGGYYLGDECCPRWKVDRIDEAVDIYNLLNKTSHVCEGEVVEGHVDVRFSGLSESEALVVAQAIADIMVTKGSIQVKKGEV